MTRASVIAPALWLLVGVSVGGCKSAPACPVERLTDPEAVLADHAARQSDWRSIAAEARVTQWGRDGRVRGTVLMFLERPSRARFDVMTQLGPAAVLTSDGESFQLSDLREGSFLYGPTCPANLARFLGISVDADDMVKLLTGDTPRIDAIDRSMECRDGRYVVTLVGADGAVQELAFSVDESDRDAPPQAQRLTLRRSTLRGPDGAVRWQAAYGEHVQIDGHRFPTEIRFVDRLHDVDTSVRVKSISLNPEVPEGAFSQTPRPGMSVELAPCP